MATWAHLQSQAFSTCEELVEAVRVMARRYGVSVTITHKSRNRPGQPAWQNRGCVVMSCVQWKHGCPFEIKGHGLIEGGWRVRPLLGESAQRHAVTSCCTCTHPQEPVRIEPNYIVKSWNELLNLCFPTPDDFIYTATKFAELNSVSVHLLTLMVTDGELKPNGKNTMYIPRGFATLQCDEADNGCPMAIKVREQEDGWYMRPWREKGRTDVKGAVSFLTCQHGKEVQAAFLLKEAERAAKPSRKRGPKRELGGSDISVDRTRDSDSAKLDGESGGGGDMSGETIDGEQHDERDRLENIHHHQHNHNDSNNQYEQAPLVFDEILSRVAGDLGADEFRLNNSMLLHHPPPHENFNAYAPMHHSYSSHGLTSPSLYAPSHLHDPHSSNGTSSLASFRDEDLEQQHQQHHQDGQQRPIASTSAGPSSLNNNHSLLRNHNGEESHRMTKKRRSNSPSRSNGISNLNHNNNQNHDGDINRSHSGLHVPQSHSDSHSHSSHGDPLASPSNNNNNNNRLPAASTSSLLLLHPSASHEPITTISPSAIKGLPPPPPLPPRSRSVPTIVRPGGLKAPWRDFLLKLDPMGRLASLAPVLISGGVDPGAVCMWPPEDIKDFVDEVAHEAPAGLRIHFRVLLMSDGRRVWDELASLKKSKT